MESAQRSRVLVRIALAVLAAAVVAPVSAQSPMPLRIYPLSGIQGTPQAAVTDVQSLLESAAAALARRGQNLHPATPLVLRSSCGRAPEASCLARLARDGIVVYGTVHSADGILAANLRAVDSKGRVHGPVRAGVDAFIQSSEPFVRALLALDVRLGLAPAVATAPGDGLQPQPPSNTIWKMKPEKTGARPGSGWRTAGKVLLVGGVALAGAGAGIGYLDRKLSDDLDAKFQAGTLTAADADSYRRVDRYNTASTMLLAAGALCATTGVTFWILAPDGAPSRGARVGVQGRF